MSNLGDIVSDETREALRQMAEQQQAAQQQRKPKDRTKMMDDIISRARAKGFRVPDHRVRWKLDHADRLLANGLVLCLGERARWLPEYDEVADWLSDNQGKGLLCIGSCGRGKTVITRDVLPWLFRHFILADLDGDGTLCHPTYHYFTANGEMKERFDEMCRARVLCIDDLGTEQTRYFGQTVNYFDRLVQNRRFEYDQLLVCSTNLTYEQLFGGEDPETHTVYPQRYDERTKSRLLGCCRRVFFVGDDMRTV